MTIVIRNNLAEVARSMLAIKSDKILIVADKQVWNIYGRQLDLKSDKDFLIWAPKSGEDLKWMESFSECLDFFLGCEIHRQVHLVAIGGGATSDFAGFIAASLLRGIPWSIVPTTLLAMIDASIGGKVGINSQHGKNLIGSFYMPENIYLNFSFLDSLPSEEINSAKGEILKYCLLSKDIAQKFERGDDMREIILSCAYYKEAVVKDDFKESGNRALLNLGHTIGHAFEMGHHLPHGLSVTLGILFIDQFFMQNRLHKEIEKFIKKLNISLPEKIEIDVNQILSYIKKDKKKQTGNAINLIVANAVGECQILPHTITKIENILKQIAGSSWQPLK